MRVDVVDHLLRLDGRRVTSCRTSVSVGLTVVYSLLPGACELLGVLKIPRTLTHGVGVRRLSRGWLAAAEGLVIIPERSLHHHWYVVTRLARV